MSEGRIHFDWTDSNQNTEKSQSGEYDKRKNEIDSNNEPKRVKTNFQLRVDTSNLSVVFGILTFEVTASHQISEVRQMIEKQTGLSPTKQILKLEDQILVDSRTLESYGISNETNLLLSAVKDDDFYNISLRDQSGFVLKVNVKLDYTIKQMKVVFGYDRGIPTEELRLFFAGTCLADSYDLKYCGINHNDEIYVAVNQKGC